MCPCGVSHGQLGASGLVVLRADYQQPWARFLLDLGKATAGILSKPRPSTESEMVSDQWCPWLLQRAKVNPLWRKHSQCISSGHPQINSSNKFIIKDHQTQQKASHYESSLAETKNPMHSVLQECQMYFEIVRHRVQNS